MLKSRRFHRLSGVLLASTVFAGGAHAAVINSVSVFATAPVGATAPDSVAVGDGSVFVAYTGGTSGRAGTGTSTVVRYSTSGAVQATFSIAGNVDGLKVNPTTGIVYALQNQDANSTVSLINPATNTVSGPLSYAAPPYVYGPTGKHGYDDVAFSNGQAYLSATNPAAAGDVVLAKLDQGNAPAGTLTTTTILTAGQIPGAFPDADSLKTKPNGDLVLTDGNGGRVITIHNPGAAGQTVIATPILFNGTQVGSLDDVLYPSATAGNLFVADAKNNRVLEVSLSGLDLNTPFVSLDNANQLVTLDASGNATPFLTSANDPLGALASPHGLGFLAVPEPASLALLGSAVMGLAGIRRRRA